MAAECAKGAERTRYQITHNVNILKSHKKPTFRQATETSTGRLV